MRSAIWNLLYNFKIMKNAYGGMLILVKLQASACNFAKINTTPWVFFTFFKLYKWYQIRNASHIFLHVAFLLLSGWGFADHWQQKDSYY